MTTWIGGNVKTAERVRPGDTLIEGKKKIQIRSVSPCSSRHKVHLNAGCYDRLAQVEVE